MNPVEIDAFKAGEYPQGKFTAKDISEMAETYDPKLYEAPITIGHLSDYQGQTKVPAFGWIGGVKAVGDHLKVVASQFSEQLKGWYKEGLYKKVSAAFFDPKDPSNPTPGKWHLHHIAFLGAKPPQVKGLEGIVFCDMNGASLEFAELEAEVVEVKADQDTYDSIAESFATCLAKVQDALAADVDIETKRSRINLALSDCYSEIQKESGLHFAFLEKAKEIEKSEMSEIRAKLKEFAARIFKHKQEEAANMDALKEKEYTDKIASLEAQAKEFAEMKAKIEAEKSAAEAAQKEAEAKAADEKLKAEVKDFCDKNGLVTKQMDDLHLQEVMFAVAKASGPLEFGEKKTTTLDVFKDIVTALKPRAEVKGGESAEFAEKPTPDGRPDVIKRAAKYVKDHPGAKEFSDCRTEADKINRVVSLGAQGKLRF